MRIRPFTPDEALSAAAWAYDPPFDIYSGDPDDAQMFLDLSDEGLGYYAIVRGELTGLPHEAEELIGFCCFGPEARVRGQDDEVGTLDLGGGVRPDLVSQQIATRVFPLVMDYALSHSRPKRIRTAVASFNERSTRLCVSAGREIARTFEGPGREFQELVRPSTATT